MIPLVVCTLWLHAPSALQSQLTQPESLYRQIVTNPTGRNGYEDYLKAGDLIRDGQFFVYRSWSPTQVDDLSHAMSAPETEEAQPSARIARRNALEFARSLSGKDDLQVQQAWVQRYGRALDLVAEGNAKPVFDPRPESMALTTRREFTAFRDLAQLFVARSYVQCAAGDVRGAVVGLLEGVTFAHRFDTGQLAGRLNGVGAAAVILSGFQEVLPLLSLRDANALRQAADAALAGRTANPPSLAGERTRAILTLRRLGEGDEAFSAGLKEIGVPPSGTQKKRFSEDEKTRILTQAQRLITASLAQSEADLRHPEREWYPLSSGWSGADREESTPSGRDPDRIAESFARTIASNLRSVFTTELRERTQLRLLRLHAAVIAYRWRHHRLPARLSDAIGEEATFDPLADAPFVYQPQPDGSYRLYSRGRLETGPIELRYQRPTAASNAMP